MIRICVADDEQIHIDRLQGYLKRYFGASSEYALTKFSDGADLVENYKPIYDVIFLDIEMPHMDGMEAARRIREKDENAVIIFLTRMAQYAVKGYEVKAFDFIIKPVDYTSFQLKLKRALAASANRQEYKLQIRPEGGLLWLNISSIYYIEVLKHDLTYYTTVGTYSARGSLTELEAELGKQGFRYCSRYCLVNLRHVKGIYEGYVLVGEKKLEISRRKRKELMDAFMEYCEG